MISKLRLACPESDFYTVNITQCLRTSFKASLIGITRYSCRVFMTVDVDVSGYFRTSSNAWRLQNMILTWAKSPRHACRLIFSCFTAVIYNSPTGILVTSSGCQIWKFLMIKSLQHNHPPSCDFMENSASICTIRNAFNCFAKINMLRTLFPRSWMGHYFSHFLLNFNQMFHTTPPIYTILDKLELNPSQQ
jgi:hypothetical protein